MHTQSCSFLLTLTRVSIAVRRMRFSSLFTKIMLARKLYFAQSLLSVRYLQAKYIHLRYVFGHLFSCCILSMSCTEMAFFNINVCSVGRSERRILPEDFCCLFVQSKDTALISPICKLHTNHSHMLG